MYRGFQLEIRQNDFIDNYHQGLQVFNALRSKVKPVLESITVQNEKLDSTKMQAEWFPEISADIFISHSHKDEDLAISFAGWLYDRFNLKTFVDSAIWKFADDLLWQLDQRYCLNPGGQTFSYESRNHSTTHVHLILQNALSKMIDKSEAIFFLNTPNSSTGDSIDQQTNSAWIFSEIALTKIIEKKEPPRADPEMSKSEDISESTRTFSFPEVAYKLDLEHLTPITYIDLRRWDRNWNQLSNSRAGNALDKLYLQLPPKPKQ